MLDNFRKRNRSAPKAAWTLNLQDSVAGPSSNAGWLAEIFSIGSKPSLADSSRPGVSDLLRPSSLRRASASSGLPCIQKGFGLKRVERWVRQPPGLLCPIHKMRGLLPERCIRSTQMTVMRGEVFGTLHAGGE